MWDTSTIKMHNTKPQIEDWESSQNSFRQFGVKMRRFHITHSRLTRGHLMSGNT